MKVKIPDKLIIHFLYDEKSLSCAFDMKFLCNLHETVAGKKIIMDVCYDNLKFHKALMSLFLCDGNFNHAVFFIITFEFFHDNF